MVVQNIDTMPCSSVKWTCRRILPIRIASSKSSPALLSPKGGCFTECSIEVRGVCNPENAHPDNSDKVCPIH